MPVQKLIGDISAPPTGHYRQVIAAENLAKKIVCIPGIYLPISLRRRDPMAFCTAVLYVGDVELQPVV